MFNKRPTAAALLVDFFVARRSNDAVIPRSSLLELGNMARIEHMANTPTGS